MEFIKIQNDYTWTIKVLESCLTEPQIEVSEKLFSRFISKWSDEISDERRLQFTHGFYRLVKSKFLEVRKNRNLSINYN
jgi:hypothetical protein